MTEDRDKRNWRDIDRRKDRSSHRQEEKTGGRPKRPKRSSHRYKDALDKAFEAGDLGKVADRLSAASPSPAPGGEKKKRGRKPSRQKLIHGIKNSGTRAEAAEKIDKLLEHYELPEDFDVLTRAVEHPDEGVVEKALTTLLLLLEEEKPRRSGALKGRLRIMEDDFDTPDELKALAQKVLRER